MIECFNRCDKWVVLCIKLKKEVRNIIVFKILRIVDHKEQTFVDSKVR